MRLKRLHAQRQKTMEFAVPSAEDFPDVIVYSSDEEEKESLSEEEDSTSSEEKNSADGSESGNSHSDTSSSEGDGEPRPKLGENNLDEDDIRERAMKRRRHRRRARKAFLLKEEKKDHLDRVRETLRMFYKKTGGITAWVRTFGWDGAVDNVAKFAGVDTAPGPIGPPVIKGITLPSNDLVGPWRRPFRSLIPLISDTLTSLRLSRNRMEGGIPRCLGNCVNLGVLNLNDNKLTGTLPSALARLTKLRVLNLRQNNIEGYANVAFSIHSLVSLDLSENNFSGPLPLHMLQKMVGLEDINLSYNAFAGPFLTKKVCTALGDKIIKVKLSRNDFNGVVAEEIRLLQNLSSLELDGNRFTGPIPEGICMVTNLRRLWLSDCDFQGNIPKHIGRLRKLRTLDIGGNSIGPFVPPSIGKLRRLTVLRIDRNELVGFLPLDEIKKLTLLEEISFRGNEFLDPVIMGMIREFALENGISLERKDKWKGLCNLPCDPASESDGSDTDKEREESEDEEDEEDEETSERTSSETTEDESSSRRSGESGGDRSNDDDSEEENSEGEDTESAVSSTGSGSTK